MKNLILVAAVLFSMGVNAQKIVITTDEMTGEKYTIADKSFIVIDDERGARVDAMIYGKDFRYLLVTNVGIGSCHENDELIFLFEGGETIEIKAWNDFNCDGEGVFDMTDELMKLLSTKKLLKLRSTNGRTYEEFTADVPEKYSDYFIQLIQNINNL